MVWQKDGGGVGIEIRKLKIFNQALLAKFVWRILTQEDFVYNSYSRRFFLKSLRVSILIICGGDFLQKNIRSRLELETSTKVWIDP